MDLMEEPKLRVCNVNYLNSVPYRCLATNSYFTYTESDPAECARRLHEDECDVACIPLAEYAMFGRYQAIRYGIASRNRAESVLLVAKSPIEDLQTIFLDTASQTSVILLRLLLHDIIDDAASITLSRATPAHAEQMLGTRVGALVIGDNALAIRDRYPYVVDLGEAWHAQTGLPFVFAVWSALPEKFTSSNVAILTQEFARGVKNREIFARHWAEQNAFPRDGAVNYVNNTIVYELGELECAGAVEFLQRGRKHGFFPDIDLTFYDSALGNNGHGIVPLSVNGGFRRRLPSTGKSLDIILSKASSGERLSVLDAQRLAGEASFGDLALAADQRCRDIHPENSVSYIIDRNINYTNVCNVYCRFCAFYRAPGKTGGYLLSHDEIGQKIEETIAAGGNQILLQGGLNPELGIEYYEELFRWIKARYPVNLHALSADEVIHIMRVSHLSLDNTLSRLIDAGLGSLPGGGAEILVDRIRRRIARLKTTAAEWLDVHRAAHRLGLSSTCTMMFGVKESWEDRILHLYKLRQLQDETNGFTAFITWSFQDENTKLKRGDTSAPEYLRVQALSRLFLDNIENIQSSWVTQGPAIGQVALFFGANDFGSVMFEENVVSAAGTTYHMDAPMVEAHIRQAGFTPWRRTIHYQQAK